MANKGSTKRRYTDEERAASLAALAANGGNVNRTAKQLGIPFMTLSSWAKGNQHPAVTQMCDQKKADLAAMFEAFVGQVLELTSEEDIKAATLKDRFTAAGIAIDKMRLLRNEATEILNANGAVKHEHTHYISTDAERLAEIRSILHDAGAGIEGDGEDGEGAVPEVDEVHTP